MQRTVLLVVFFPFLRAATSEISVTSSVSAEEAEDTGKEEEPKTRVHVRDVAAAQVLLLETPSASGRHLCTNGIYQFKDFAETVAQLCPEYNVHRSTEETQPGLVSRRDAAKKLINTGLVLTPVEETIKEAEASLKANGSLSQPNLQS